MACYRYAAVQCIRPWCKLGGSPTCAVRYLRCRHTGFQIYNEANFSTIVRSIATLKAATQHLSSLPGIDLGRCTPSMNGWLRYRPIFDQRSCQDGFEQCIHVVHHKNPAMKIHTYVEGVSIPATDEYFCVAEPCRMQIP